MSTDMIVPARMHEPVTAEQYDSWSQEQCAGIGVVDGIVVSSGASVRHNFAGAVEAVAPFPVEVDLGAVRGREKVSPRRVGPGATSSTHR